MIHYEDGYTSSDSHLLDFNANTSGNFADAPLQLGRTWSDPYSNLTLTVNSVTSTGMTVTVNYGAKTCVPSEPTVTLSPTATSAEQGKSTQLAVTVRNNSTAECGNEVFALASAAVGSLTTTLGTRVDDRVAGPGRCRRRSTSRCPRALRSARIRCPSRPVARPASSPAPVRRT